MRAGGDKVAFPADYAKGVLYTTVDRADNKQYRELYAPKAAIDAVKAGKPIPSGTVLTMRQLQGQARGRRQSREGRQRPLHQDRRARRPTSSWRSAPAGAPSIPTTCATANGSTRRSRPAKTVNDKANLKACFTCHKPLDKQDFVFSFDKMKTAK